jgi:hypothetical protein
VLDTKKTNRYRQPRRISLGTLLGCVMIAFFISYQLGKSNGEIASYNTYHTDTEPKQGNQDEALANVNFELRQQVVRLERDNQIQLEAKKNLANHLKALQEQNTELTRDMALYQTIAGTSSVGQGLQIKAFQVFRMEGENTFRYLLVLSKQAAPQKYAEGAVTMTIIGMVDQKPIHLPVKYVDSGRVDGLAFKFRHFQELTGELSFPQGFVPEGVLFQVTPDSEWPYFQQQFPWVTDTGAALVEE